MRKPYLIGILIGLLLAGGVVAVLLLCAVGRGPTMALRGGGIGLIAVDGGIYVADGIVEEIEEARKTAAVKAVVVRINSPGGSVGASQEIYHALLNLRKEKPLIASIGNIAASGGYYIACAAQQIFALPGSITGSIGVRMSHVNAAELFRLARVEPEVLKSGMYKDAGSLYRAMTPEERGLFQQLLATMHRQFKEAVAAGRGLDLATVTAVADGRVLAGEEALHLKLIDQIGSLPDAVRAAAGLAGIAGEPRVVEFRKGRPWWWEILFEESAVVHRRIGEWFGDWLRWVRIGYWTY